MRSIESMTDQDHEPRPRHAYNGSEHPPQHDFVMAFSDETADERPLTLMDDFVEDLRIVAAKYGFDISQWGTRNAMMRALGGELSRRIFNDRLEAELARLDGDD